MDKTFKIFLDYVFRGQDGLKGITDGLKGHETQIKGIKDALGKYGATWQTVRGEVLRFAAAFAGLSFIKSSVASLNASDTALIKLQGTMRATGQYTKEQINTLVEWTDQLERTKGIEDESSAAALAVLGSMKLSTDVMQRALMTAQDMSNVFGGDLTSNAQSLGRALSNPIESLRLLRQYGIAWNETVFQGKTLMEAQEMILRELGSRIGGVSDQLATTEVGKMQIFNAQLDNTKKKFGEISRSIMIDALPAVNAFIRLLDGDGMKTALYFSAVGLAVGKLAAESVRLGKLSAELKILNNTAAGTVGIFGRMAGVAGVALGAAAVALFGIWSHYKAQIDKIEAEEKRVTDRVNLQVTARKLRSEWKDLDLVGIVSKEDVEAEKKRLKEIEDNIKRVAPALTIADAQNLDAGKTEGYRIFPGLIDEAKRWVTQYNLVIQEKKKLDETAIKLNNLGIADAQNKTAEELTAELQTLEQKKRAEKLQTTLDAQQQDEQQSKSFEDAMDKQREILDNFTAYEYENGRLSVENYIASLRAKQDGFIAYSNEWMTIENQINTLQEENMRLSKSINNEQAKDASKTTKVIGAAHAKMNEDIKKSQADALAAQRRGVVDFEQMLLFVAQSMGQAFNQDISGKEKWANFIIGILRMFESAAASAFVLGNALKAIFSNPFLALAAVVAIEAAIAAIQNSVREDVSKATPAAEGLFVSEPTLVYAGEAGSAARYGEYFIPGNKMEANLALLRDKILETVKPGNGQTVHHHYTIVAPSSMASDMEQTKKLAQVMGERMERSTRRRK